MDGLTIVFLVLLAVVVLAGTVVVANLIKKGALEMKENQQKANDSLAELVADKVVEKMKKQG